ncbi:MAG TPA: DegT/DnrJ/EryC1/StrS family aminotransferase [Myxococcales bacterium]|nr:DegT/DnrJ/EryC1/StrS family aminotransferase [Myxococcales bacterium]
MEAVKQSPKPSDRATALARRYVPALPTLWPNMLVGRRRWAPPFPFGADGACFYYLARNAVWNAVKLLSLQRREVLVPAYHHGVEIEALVDAGAIPRFYPVNLRMAIDPDDLARRLGPDTGAVYVIHYLGFPQALDPILELCRARGIPLIEDCALALLSRDGDRPLGARGDVSIFCLYKTLPVPHGGALLVNGPWPRGVLRPLPPRVATTLSRAGSALLSNLELRAGRLGGWLARSLRAWGRAAATGLSLARVPTGTQHFDRGQVRLGMAELSNRIAENQDVERIVAIRRRNFFFLLGRLREVAPPVLSELPPGVCPLFYPLWAERKDVVLKRLRALGVEAIDFWRFGHPGVRPGEFEEVERLRGHVVELPIHQDLTPDAMEFVSGAARQALA